MKTDSYLPLRLVLGLMSAYHIVAGVAATFAQEAAVRIGGFLFGVQIALNPQTEVIVRYLGAFGITVGVLAALAALDPARNKAIVWGLIVYCLVRVFDRIMFWSLLQQFHVGPLPAWMRIAGILVFASALFFFSREPKTQAS
jgi:hypothetical protein